MKKMILVLFIILCGFIVPQVSPTEGDVVINTFDSRYGTAANAFSEFAVLVNRTNTTIDLNGYELRGFARDGTTQYSYYQWNTQTLMQPYSFLLISTPEFQAIVGVPTSDFTLNVPVGGHWDEKGYLVLRKQPSGTPVRSDYIDVVKFTRWFLVAPGVFTGVPEGSDMTLADDSVDVGSTGQQGLATRGGISNNFASLIYTGYNVANDFTFKTEASTVIQNSSSPPLTTPIVAISEGDVVINTFDSRYGGTNNSSMEFVVLVNRTNQTIDLNGYEIRTFEADGVIEYNYYQFTSGDEMQPYSFLLISSTEFQALSGVPTSDFTFLLTGGNHWNDDGYLVFRKIPSVTPVRADYIDVVKHVNGGAGTFTGVPVGSDMNTTDPNVDLGFNSEGFLATRGGITGNLSSLIYTDYNVAADFSTPLETATTIQNSGSSPLPVELSSFSAIVLKNGVKLNWKTETEVNNYGFDVERSKRQEAISETWEKIGFVDGNGNSNSPKNYTYTDRNVASGKYAYRLKQIDNDGKYEYSKIIEVDLFRPTKFELSQNYPNPFNPTTTIRFSILEAGNVKLTLFNILGQEIRTLVNEYKEAGVHTINFNAEELNSGLYLYKLEANGLVQTRKMTLVK